MRPTPEGQGKRKRVEIEGENYYLIATRDADGQLAFMVTCPDENKATGMRRRLTAERICQEITDLAREV